MIKVQIDLSAQIKNKVVNPPEVLEFTSPCSVQDCVRTLAEDCGDEFKQFVFNDKGCLRSTVLLAINDAQICWDEPEILNDGDRVSIFSPIAGGQRI